VVLESNGEEAAQAWLQSSVSAVAGTDKIDCHQHCRKSVARQLCPFAVITFIITIIVIIIIVIFAIIVNNDAKYNIIVTIIIICAKKVMFSPGFVCS